MVYERDGADPISQGIMRQSSSRSLDPEQSKGLIIFIMRGKKERKNRFAWRGGIHAEPYL
jgi:hypothetical protein